MKPPLRTDPIIITAYSVPGRDYAAKATVESSGAPPRLMRAASTCSHESAARNLALRHFFGGNTLAFAGPEENAAINLIAIGSLGHPKFRAELTP